MAIQSEVISSISSVNANVNECMYNGNLCISSSISGSVVIIMKEENGNCGNGCQWAGRKI